MCRTREGYGVYSEIWELSQSQCEARCAVDGGCVAYEHSTFPRGGARGGAYTKCELHTVPATHTVPASFPVVCRVLQPAPANPPSRGRGSQRPGSQTRQRGAESSSLPLPAARYAFSSFVTPTPRLAAAFLVDYLGAALLEDPRTFQTRAAAHGRLVAAVRFRPGSTSQATQALRADTRHLNEGPHDVYFVRSDEPPASEGSLLTAERLADEMSKVHRFGVQETWDWWQDWHLALWTENLDAVLVRLLRDGVPFVTRGTSAYVEIPRGITFQLQGLNMSLAATEPFTFCRATTPTSRLPTPPPSAWRSAVRPDAPLPPIPHLQAKHFALPTDTPEAALQHLQRFIGGEGLGDVLTFLQPRSHRFSNGECAMLKWQRLADFDLHFVHQFSTTDQPSGGSTASVREVQRRLVAGHAKHAGEDVGQLALADPALSTFLGNGLGLRVSSLEPFRARLDAARAPYYVHSGDSSQTRRSLYVPLATGFIVELQEEK